MEYYFHRYGDLDLQRRMVGDRRRTDTFARAIREVVRPGDRVLDVGTGTGVLAMLCAKAGAAQVYAIDQAEITQTAANLVKANGLQDKVHVMRGPAAELRLDEPVDVLVSEWLGNMALVENMLEDVLIARDRNLADEGRMIPSRVDVCLAPVDDPILYGLEGPGFWRRSIHGLDFSMLEDVELRQGRAQQIRVEPPALLSEAHTLVSLDIERAEPHDAWRAGRLEFKVLRDGVLNGFVGWFVAELSPYVCLDTGPFEPETHWSQSYLCFPPRRVEQGSTLVVEYDLQRQETEFRHIELTLSVGNMTQTFILE